MARTVPLLSHGRRQRCAAARRRSPRQNRQTALAIAAGVAPGKTKDEARKAIEEVMRAGAARFPAGYG